MELALPTSTEDVYWSLIGLLLLTALVLAIYVAAAMAGFVPTPPEILTLDAAPAVPSALMLGHTP